jgi:hypothetical protein
MSEQKEYSPYCPVCTACGIDGCCSPLSCEMTEGCSYPSYLEDLKFGYAMNEWVQKNLLDEKLIPKELIEKYNEEWEKAYDIFYKKREETEDGSTPLGGLKDMD